MRPIDLQRAILCFLVSIILTYAERSLAADYLLFESDTSAKSYPVADYDTIVKNLISGDTLYFTDGTSFTIEAELGRGTYTRVFSIQGDPQHALRIPRDSSPFFAESAALGFLQGNRELAKQGVRVVHVSRSYRYEYAEVERLNGIITYRDFFEKFAALSKRERGQAISAMDTFLKSVAGVESIMDLHAENLGYIPEKKEWIIFDSAALIDHIDFNQDLDKILRSKSILNDFHLDLSPEAFAPFKELIKRWQNVITTERTKIHQSNQSSAPRCATAAKFVH